MKNGICPKCSGKNILVCEASDSKKESGNADYEKLGMLGKKVYTTRYVCCECGYTERYFEDKNLEILQKRYNKA